MKAIQVTQDLKNKNLEFFANNTVGQIVQKAIPNRFNGVENVVGGYASREDLQALDGWKEVVIPTFDSATQKRGNTLILSGYNYTYEVIALTESEILDRTLNEAESARQARLQQEQVKIVEEKFQAIEDDADIIENADAYPLWRNIEDGFNFPLNFKTRDFDENNELQIFRVIQSHNKQSDFMPNIVPALFSKILIGGGGIEIWTQPTGGDGKYPYLDPATGEPYQVIHNGFIWANNNQGSLNVWEPSVFGWTML